MKTTFTLFIIFTVTLQLISQEIIYKHNFENENSWTLDYTFDDGGDDFCFAGLQSEFKKFKTELENIDSKEIIIGAEDTNGEPEHSPADGIITLSTDSIIDVSKYISVGLKISVASGNGNYYDQRDYSSGDYLDLQIQSSVNAWVTIGSFCSPGGSNGRLYNDKNLNGIGGENGESIIDNSFKDFLFMIPDSIKTFNIRVVFRFESGNEEIAFSNIRVVNLEGKDYFPPYITDFKIYNQTEAIVVFNEPTDTTALDKENYLGLGDIKSISNSITKDTVFLTLATNIILGEQDTLIVKEIRDTSKNIMNSTFQLPFIFNNSKGKIVISEIMYNDPGSGSDSLEFIEIKNIDDYEISLGGYHFTAGIIYEFPNIKIKPNELIVLAKDSSVIKSVFNIYCLEWESGTLSNSGEILQIENTEKDTIINLKYDDTSLWPSDADGNGSSLILCDLSSDYNDPSNWSASKNYLLKNSDDNIICASPNKANNCLLSSIRESQSEVSFYPNPTSGLLMILGDNINLIEVYNIQGVIVYQLKNHQININKVDLRKLSNGTYFIKIYSNNSTYSKQIIKYSN